MLHPCCRALPTARGGLNPDRARTREKLGDFLDRHRSSRARTHVRGGVGRTPAVPTRRWVARHRHAMCCGEYRTGRRRTREPRQGTGHQLRHGVDRRGVEPPDLAGREGEPLDRLQGRIVSSARRAGCPPGRGTRQSPPTCDGRADRRAWVSAAPRRARRADRSAVEGLVGRAVCRAELLIEVALMKEGVECRDHHVHRVLLCRHGVTGHVSTSSWIRVVACHAAP